MCFYLYRNSFILSQYTKNIEEIRRKEKLSNEILLKDIYVCGRSDPQEAITPQGCNFECRYMYLDSILGFTATSFRNTTLKKVSQINFT